MAKNDFLYWLAIIWVFSILVGITAFLTYIIITVPMVRWYFGGIFVLLLTIVAATYLANNK